MLNVSPGRFSSSPFLQTLLDTHDYVNKDSQRLIELLPQTGQHDPGGIVAFPLTQLTSGHFTSCKINNHIAKYSDTRCHHSTL